MFQNKFHEEDRFFKINSNLKACLKDNFIFMLNSEPLWEKRLQDKTLYLGYIYTSFGYLWAIKGFQNIISNIRGSSNQQIIDAVDLLLYCS